MLALVLYVPKCIGGCNTANINKNPTALTLTRRAAGLSRTQLADKTGISDRTIERWEQRRSDIGSAEAASVWAIATALHCDVEKLLDIIPEIDVTKRRLKSAPIPQKKDAVTNLKKYRVGAGYSLSELAEISGTQLQTLASYEAQRNNINHATTNAVFALSKALNVSFGEILD